MNQLALRYLATLRLIPDDIVLSMASREILPWDPDSCICGWAVREALARAAGVDADVTGTSAPVNECMTRFGGRWEQWWSVFSGINSGSTGQAVEEAFVVRVMEAAGVAS